MEVMNVHLRQYVQMKWVTTYVPAKMDSMVTASLVLVSLEFGLIVFNSFAQTFTKVHGCNVSVDKSYFCHY